MGFAVEMHFDAPAEARVRALWNELAREGIGSAQAMAGWRPHLSLAVFDRLDVGRARRDVECLASKVPPLTLSFASVGSFPTQEGVVFLAPVVTAELLGFHRCLHTRLEKLGARALEHYRPGRWVPHCTVAIDLDPEQVPQAIDICRGSRAFGPFTLSAIGLVEYRPARPICSFALGETRADLA